jgi:hypothetical protein
LVMPEVKTQKDYYGKFCEFAAGNVPANNCK